MIKKVSIFVMMAILTLTAGCSYSEIVNLVIDLFNRQGIGWIS